MTCVKRVKTANVSTNSASSMSGLNTKTKAQSWGTEIDRVKRKTPIV
jgi:hypothetical protein